MYEKYLDDLANNKNKNTINDKYNIIFMYTLKDAWSMPIKSVIVTNEDGDNLYLISNYDEEKKCHINCEKISSIIIKYLDKFDKIKNKELPKQFIMDGYINTIDFKVNNKWYNYEFNNLGFYSEDDINKNEYLSLIFGLLIDLDDELEDQVKEVEKYFILLDEEDTEEDEEE